MFSQFNDRLRESRDDESGFTILELLVVIAVIGLMTLTAIPVFLNQREMAAAASVRSEVRNAAMVMEQNLINNHNKYLPYLPNYVPSTSGVEVTVDKSRSTSTKFCLNGKSVSHPNVKYSWDSSMGGMLTPVQSCLPVSTGQSFKSALASKKVLIVYTFNASDQTAWKNYFTSLGYGTVTFMDNPSILEYKNYDVIAAMTNAWAIPSNVYSNLKAGFGQGSRIITDGNDNGQYQMDNLILESIGSGGSSAGKSVWLNRTGNKVTPAFPYTFENTSFGSDSGWQCITKIQPGAVAVTDSIHPSDSSKKCITGIAAANVADGRWVHFSIASMAAGGPTESAMDWLTND